MSVALWCLMITGLLPIVCAGISKWGASDYDNRAPREWLARQEGYRRRANAAQANSWEAFIWFGIAMAIALVTKADPDKLDGLALFFLASRVLYIGFYVADKSGLRSLAWLAGLITTLTVFASGTT
ncbi:MAG: hypothetical protein FGM22_05685 [Burkholderiaceae bacterium]|jgi:uncharacterized MAPEG superfamily protein|nr:hypothetical protein [Burkholderiaceae bacterium]